MQAGVAADLTKAMMKMTQAERRMYLIKSLLAERQDYLQAEIPQGGAGSKGTASRAVQHTPAAAGQ